MNRPALVLFFSSHALVACSRDLGVPDGECGNECTAQWTENCERNCGISTPSDAGSGHAGRAGSVTGSGISGSGAGGGDDGGSSGSSGGAGDGGSTGTGGSSGSTAGDGGTGGTIGDGGEAGDAAAACNTTASPLTEPCLIDDDFAVFVSPTGGTTADGTMADPIALTAAVDEAIDRGVKLIFLCNGDYDDPLVIDGADKLVKIYGGFDCAGDQWEPASSGSTTIAPAAGVALHVKDTTQTVRIENVAFVAADATDAGGSSIAAIVDHSTDVVLRGVDLTAGQGMDGANADTPTQFEFPMTSGCTGTADDPDNCLEGQSASGTTGGLRRDFVCSGSGFLMTSGGRGGNGGASPEMGLSGTPSLGAGQGGPGGAPCTGGSDGAGADTGADGNGAAIQGAITSGTWSPASGATGVDGDVGQGGGGGGATTAGGGGGGGAGGCGGKAGGGGGGGGASIALLSIDSGVSLTGCKLIADDAGDGGDGAAGLAGMSAGGAGGDGANAACGGGNGGPGGQGGDGGGGAGGISVGIAYTGSIPMRISSLINTGSFGMAGQGAGTSNDGIAGVAQVILDLN